MLVNSLPCPCRYVSVTFLQCGWSEDAASTRSRRVTARDITAASAVADGPSYMDALATSIPVSSHTMVWNS